MATKKKAPKGVNRETVSKILRTLPHHNAFYFFTDLGQYSGDFVASLSDFGKKLETIDTASVDFHFKRGDLAKWIRETVGDVELADEISEIPESLKGERLRDTICQTVNRHLTKLKKSLASKGKYLERI
jgi:hypothetical protein